MLLFISSLFLYAIIAAMTGSEAIGVIGLIAAVIFAIYRVRYENTPEGIEEIKKKHQLVRKRCMENASKCSRCESSDLSTTWVDTWNIGKIGRKTVYMCNECGLQWQINSHGNVKRY
jgi:hypothetical protein